jgi:hypothetical protein
MSGLPPIAAGQHLRRGWPKSAPMPFINASSMPRGQFLVAPGRYLFMAPNTMSPDNQGQSHGWETRRNPH